MYSASTQKSGQSHMMDTTIGPHTKLETVLNKGQLLIQKDRKGR